MCAVLEGFISVALCPDTKKTFKRWQKAEVKKCMFSPSSPSDHYKEIYEKFYVNRLVKDSPPRLQDPSLIYKGNWGDSPGYPAIFQGCRTLVLGIPQDLPVMGDENLLCLIAAVWKHRCPISVHQTRAQGRDPPGFRPQLYIARQPGIVLHELSFRSKTDIFLPLKDIQARARRHANVDIPLHFSSFTQPPLRQGFWHCTPQCGINRSRTASASLLRELFPLGKLWVFPQGQFGCVLSDMPERGTNVSAHPQRQKKGYALCLVIIALSVPTSNIAKQRGNISLSNLYPSSVSIKSCSHALALKQRQ